MALDHRSIIILSVAAVTVTYSLEIIVALNLYDDQQIVPILVVMLPMMAIQYLNLIFLTPDRDHLTIRLTIAHNPWGLLRQAIWRQLSLSEDAALDGLNRHQWMARLDSIPSDDWSEFSYFVRTNAVVQRSLPTWLQILAGLGLVILGAVFGDWYAIVFQPPEVSGASKIQLQVATVIVTALTMLMISQLLRFLGYLDVRYARRVAEKCREVVR